MKIVVGLGNPGDKYKYTRHNAGFMALDHYLQGKELIKCQSKFGGNICEMHFHATKTFFVKPAGYMNTSGEVVQEIMKFYKVDPQNDLLVIHDEIDLKFGYHKFAKDSGHAGHNGVRSIIDHIGTQDFARIRIGIETRQSKLESPTEDFVLHNFTKEQIGYLHDNIFPKVDKEIDQFIGNK